MALQMQRNMGAVCTEDIFARFAVQGLPFAVYTEIVQKVSRLPCVRCRVCLGHVDCAISLCWRGLCAS